MKIAVLATMILWGAIFLLIALCFPNFIKAEPVISVRTYYKPGYQAVSLDHARAMHRIALRRTEKIFPVRFSHRLEVISPLVAPHEREYVGCYRILSFENGACCPNEYIARHWEQTKAWKRKEVAMFINPPVGANDYYQGRWLSGGIAMRGCWHWEPNMPIGIVNATEVNFNGESRRRAMIEVYRHELYHAAFNAQHDEKSFNIMSTFSPQYNRVEFETAGEIGLVTTEKTIKQAMNCIRQKRGKK